MSEADFEIGQLDSAGRALDSVAASASASASAVASGGGGGKSKEAAQAKRLKRMDLKSWKMKISKLQKVSNMFSSMVNG